MPLLIKQTVAEGGEVQWKKSLHFLKDSGNTWKTVPQIYVKTTDGWKPLYSFTWSIGAWSACSAGCGGGTQTRTVQCKRSDGTLLPDSVCANMIGTKPATVQFCNTHTCTYYIYGNADDFMMLYTLVNNSWWRPIFDHCYMTHRDPRYYAVTSPEFAQDEVKLLYAMSDTNGTSYHAWLQMCTATNVCTDRIVYFPHQGECDGMTLYFTWYPKTRGFVRHRCTGWRHRNQGQCSGCSGCTDGGIGYLNCAGGGPGWAYIPIPHSGPWTCRG